MKRSATNGPVSQEKRLRSTRRQFFLRTYPNTEHLDTFLRIDGNLSAIFSLHGGVKYDEETESLCLVST